LPLLGQEPIRIDGNVVYPQSGKQLIGRKEDGVVGNADPIAVGQQVASPL
jgi:hypothetical protein